MIMGSRYHQAIWLARLILAGVFAVNVLCAAEFIAWPQRYAASFELEGVPGQTMVRAIGVLFLMWNATYPPVMWRPERQLTLFIVVLAQQAIGLAGESVMWAMLPSSHHLLRTTGLRFIVFDGAGLLLMLLAFCLLLAALRRRAAAECPQAHA